MSLEGDPRVRYSTIRAMQFLVGLHRVYTAVTSGDAHRGDSVQPVDAARVGARCGLRETCLSPVTDGPRQT